MRLKKGGLYSVKLDENKYLYIHYITGGNVGDLLKIFNYSSSVSENDIFNITESKSLYPEEYIIGFLDVDISRLTLIGHIKVDYLELMKKSFFTRRSINCGLMKESFSGDMDDLEKRFNNGERYYYNDWRLEEHKIIGSRGKFDFIKEHYVGRLPKEYVNCFNSMIFPHIDDFIQMLQEGKDRNLMLMTVYQ